MPQFIPGLKLCRLFYHREVKPILQEQFPELSYAAAVIGWGSEVLGFDTETSSDHHWGPRVLLFLTEREYPKLSGTIAKTLSAKLPYEFMGYSTNFGEPEPNGIRHALKIDNGPVNHMINIYTVRSFVKARLGFDPKRKMTVADWLTCPQQRLLELISGEVYHDGLGELEKVRTELEFYPRDVWLYVLAAQWRRISQEEAFVGRTGEVGDELGSQLVASRLVREIIKLSFLMERQYAPYSKWLGSAFNQLKIAKTLKPIFRRVLSSLTWKARERWLAKAYSIVAAQHNDLRLTKPLSVATTTYYSRPYRVIFAERFATAIKSEIRDPLVKKISIDIGSIDQFTDNTDLIENPGLARKLQALYEMK